ncbi:hypothetical protein BpHYR1_002136 [Brachionus plicatilis]|uniref:Uncharacterized protein n=1 Tax=Brachionus plicatilis TaxID=10195 RepID=A0A3M7RWW4_BRAPC|nr:hypothetical protein BpHYR1_002136 [Brachionus plicatilis]
MKFSVQFTDKFMINSGFKGSLPTSKNLKLVLDAAKTNRSITRTKLAECTRQKLCISIFQPLGIETSSFGLDDHHGVFNLNF